MDGCRTLRDKYLTLRELRLARAASGAAAPRDQLLALARRFPGALRELDQLPLPEIEARIAALDALLAGEPAPLPGWVALQLAYHGWMRIALRVREVPSGEPIAATVERLRGLAPPVPGEPDPGQLGPSDLEAIRRGIL